MCKLHAALATLITPQLACRKGNCTFDEYEVFILIELYFLCQLFPTLSALSPDWRYGRGDEAKNSLGLFQPHNGLQISLQPLRSSRVDACYLQSAAVCQRYDYREWQRYIRDFNLSYHSMATKMALFSFLYLRSHRKWHRLHGGKEGVREIIKACFSKERMRQLCKLCLWRCFQSPTVASLV